MALKHLVSEFGALELQANILGLDLQATGHKSLDTGFLCIEYVLSKQQVELCRTASKAAIIELLCVFEHVQYAPA